MQIITTIRCRWHSRRRTRSPEVARAILTTPLRAASSHRSRSMLGFQGTATLTSQPWLRRPTRSKCSVVARWAPVTRAPIVLTLLPPIIEIDHNQTFQTQLPIGTQATGLVTTWKWVAHLTTYLSHTLKNGRLSLRVLMPSMETDVKTAPHADNSKTNRRLRTKNNWTGGMMTTSVVLSVDPQKQFLSSRQVPLLTDMTMAAVGSHDRT